jgi:hypothetical protein
VILRIRNWQKFQHYKNRRPPWTKLHFALLSSRDWIKSSDSERLLMVVCMLISSQSEYMDGRFDADSSYIGTVAHLDNKPNFQPLIDMGFLVEVASTAQANARIVHAKAEPEKRREEERRDRGEKAAHKPRVPHNLSDEAKEMRDRGAIAAQAKRLADEREVYNQTHVGAGPETRRPIGFDAGLAEFLAKAREVGGKL